MRTLAVVAALTLITLSTKCNVFASLTLKDIILKCEAGMTAQDCKSLIESNGFSTNITKISARTSKGTDVADIFYYQVDMYVDYHGYVLGPQPNFDGTVSYPYEWRGGPVKKRGTRYVGPWNCKGLTYIKCCAKIESDVYDADVNGNYLSCFQEEAFYIDPVTQERYGVFLNPVDNSINYLTEEELTQLEDREQTARDDLIALIDDTLVNNHCPKATLKQIHAGFLFAMRGVPEARAFPKYTKEVIRMMNREVMDVIDATQNEILQEWLPKMKAVVHEVAKNGGLHPIDKDDNEAYVIRQVANATTEVPTVKIIGQLRSASDITRTPDKIVTCIEENSDLHACTDLLEGVTVITVHPRSPDDPFYNQVVIPIDYRGFVLGSQPKYDGKIFYQFLWRGNPANGLGTRQVGPWDCQGLTEVQCCDLIQADVPDQDVNGKYIDCWFSESFYKDPFTKRLAKIFFDKATGKIDYAKPHDLDNYRIQEEKFFTQLSTAISKVLAMTECPIDLLWGIYRGTRHALREHPGFQGDPETIRELLLLESGGVVNVLGNTQLQAIFQRVLAELFSSASSLILTPEQNKVVVVTDEHDNVVDMARIVGSN